MNYTFFDKTICQLLNNDINFRQQYYGQLGL